MREQAIASLLISAEDRPPHAAPFFAYLFDNAQNDATGLKFGSFHTAEVPYVFGTTARAIVSPRAIDRKLERTIGRYWTNFIRTGNPNGAGLPAWPSLATVKLMLLGKSPHAQRPMASERLFNYRLFVRNGGRLSLF
ncbi:carboxylesterase family protein [Aquisediminimonas profunda]|uniref:carboxylesterase family protein n=1 Tax=Aquisediminimonas profunda TaxID=1550733 RepID=UPI001C62E81B|nr:carboxylesterase family protein [Aquisediminimonas profunda]